MHGQKARAGADVGDPRARLDAERLDDLLGPALGIEPRLLARVSSSTLAAPEPAGRPSASGCMLARASDEQTRHTSTRASQRA